ncbi:MAG TPA: hypothetical protein VKH45_12055 [Candidatus Acidoferrum sp.]|nr:hypothetical protein [Candidatus Acidoferrum sp.]
MKTRSQASTHKKVVVELQDRKSLRGFLNPARLQDAAPLDLLTPYGEHEEIVRDKIRAVYFVRDLNEDFEPERKTFLSRPKLDGLWVKLRFLDDGLLEGVIPNDLLNLMDQGLHLTPPDFHSNTDRIYVPRTALAELSVLGVVGIARRKTAAVAAAQPRLFNE